MSGHSTTHTAPPLIYTYMVGGGVHVVVKDLRVAVQVVHWILSTRMSQGPERGVELSREYVMSRLEPSFTEI
jgi:hypothetical protein